MVEPADVPAPVAAAADTVIVVPCFNEAGRLDLDAFDRFLARDHTVHFLFVDDGSSDDTAPVLRGLCERHPERCELLVAPANRGKGEAVRLGLRTVLDRRQPRFVGYWDADLSAPLGEILRMCPILQRRDDIDIVLGIRRPLLGHRVQRAFIRGLLARAFSRVVSLLLGRRFLDTQCGAKLLRATPALRSALQEEFLSRWIFDVELLLRCTSAGARGGDRWAAVYEYPLETWMPRDASNVMPWSYAVALIELPLVVGKDRRRGDTHRA